MSRYQARFASLAERQQGAFVPFVTLGDPTPQASIAQIKALIDGGADALELGMPFSDPVADGPVIQRANIRALEAGTKFQDCLQILREIRAYDADIPIGLLTYANLLFAKGVDNSYQQLREAEVDSVLLADTPVREGIRFSAAAKRHGIAPIFIAPPDASDALQQQIAQHSEGYIYLLSRAGVTGTDVAMQSPATQLLQRFKSLQAAPCLLGFGISTPDHVSAAIAAGAAGAISGSAVVAIIEKNLENEPQRLAALQQFVAKMKAATLKE